MPHRLFRRHSSELRAAREDAWAREADLAAARDKLAALKATVDERRRDIVSYKVKRGMLFAVIQLPAGYVVSFLQALSAL